MHGGPDGIFDALASPRVEHAGAHQLIESGAEMTEGRALLPYCVRSTVAVLLGEGECGSEQPRFLAREVEVGDTDGAEATASRGWIGVLATDSSDAVGHAVGELEHRRRGDRGEELVAVGEMPVGGVRHHSDPACRLTKHHRVRATGARQVEPCSDQAVADSASRPAPPLSLLHLRR